MNTPQLLILGGSIALAISVGSIILILFHLLTRVERTERRLAEIEEQIMGVESL